MFSNSLRFYFRLFLIILPIIIFGTYIFQNAVNVPYDDDEALLISINSIHENSGNLFHALVLQHNDHRIFFSRLAAVLIEFFNGEMNFRIMIILWVSEPDSFRSRVVSGVQNGQRQLIFFLPVTVLIFSPIVYVVHFWSITAFEQTLAITFSLYSLYFLQSFQTKNLVLVFPICHRSDTGKSGWFEYYSSWTGMVDPTKKNQRKCHIRSFLCCLSFSLFSGIQLFLFF